MSEQNVFTVNTWYCEIISLFQAAKFVTGKETENEQEVGNRQPLSPLPRL